MKSMDKVYGDICRRLHKIIDVEGNFKKQLKAYGCTNYMDARIIYSMKYLMGENALTKEKLQALRDLYVDFVKATSDGKYYLSESGNYTLIAQPETVLKGIDDALAKA